MSEGTGVARGKLLLVVNVGWFFLSHRIEVAKRAMADGYEVHLATHCETEWEAQSIQELGITLYALPLRRGGTSPVADLLYLGRLWCLIRKVRPDVVHSVTPKPVLYGGVAARALNVRRYVAALSGLGYSFTGERADSWLARAMVSVLRYALNWPGCRLILQNSDDKRELESHGVTTRIPVTIIRGSGVDLDEFFYSPEEDSKTHCIVLAARMLRDKGVVEFAEAAAIVQQECPGTEFLLAGPLDCENPTGLSRQQITELELQYGVRWLGRVEDVAGLYRKASLVCLPSYREGLPKSLIEACATGRAIVTTNVPGCREVVVDGWNGRLVPARDSDSLAAAIIGLLAEPTTRAEMGRHGRQLAEREFDVHSVAERTVALYDDDPRLGSSQG